MIEINVNTLGIDVPLQQLQERLRNLGPVMQSIGAEMESRVAQRFETRSDPDGQAWAPWAESTRKRYPKDARGKLLERYGDMVNSLNWRADATSARIGFGAVASRSRDVYAVYHEFGTARMPRRGLLTADPEEGRLGAADEAAVIALLEDWLTGAI